jgi:hypothetical protein
VLFRRTSIDGLLFSVVAGDAAVGGAVDGFRNFSREFSSFAKRGGLVGGVRDGTLFGLRGRADGELQGRLLHGVASSSLFVYLIGGLAAWMASP